MLLLHYFLVPSIVVIWDQISLYLEDTTIYPFGDPLDDNAVNDATEATVSATAVAVIVIVIIIIIIIIIFWSWWFWLIPTDSYFVIHCILSNRGSGTGSNNDEEEKSGWMIHIELLLHFGGI